PPGSVPETGPCQTGWASGNPSSQSTPPGQVPGCRYARRRKDVDAPEWRTKGLAGAGAHHRPEQAMPGCAALKANSCLKE
ncbi:hypothetical protein, partial [Acinetobacter baumannii]|uniref:hypothetical protein n=1 Tax=Acinetobacter baumannii TaxID=470 RepID=UPI00148A2997